MKPGARASYGERPKAGSMLATSEKPGSFMSNREAVAFLCTCILSGSSFHRCKNYCKRGVK